MKGLKDSDLSQNEWIQVWLSRLSAETQLLNFSGPVDFNEFGKSLASLSVEDPERFQEFSVGLLPRALKALSDNDSDDSSWAPVFDKIGSLFPEFKDFNRPHVLWLIRQVQASKELITKLHLIIESGDVNIEQGLENWRCDILNGAILPDTIRPDIFVWAKTSLLHLAMWCLKISYSNSFNIILRLKRFMKTQCYLFQPS